jgi:hypothetical protein
MVGLTQPEGADPQAAKQFAEPDVALLIGIPLRDHHHRAPAMRRGLKILGVRGIVFRMRALERTGELQRLPLYAKIAWGAVPEKLFRTRNGPVREIEYGSSRIARFSQIQPVSAPVKG